MQGKTFHTEISIKFNKAYIGDRFSINLPFYSERNEVTSWLIKFMFKFMVFITEVRLKGPVIIFGGYVIECKIGSIIKIIHDGFKNLIPQKQLKNIILIYI